MLLVRSAFALVTDFLRFAISNDERFYLERSFCYRMYRANLSEDGIGHKYGYEC
jgi:hypothetical protein